MLRRKADSDDDEEQALSLSLSLSLLAALSLAPDLASQNPTSLTLTWVDHDPAVPTTDHIPVGRTGHLEGYVSGVPSEAKGLTWAWSLLHQGQIIEEELDDLENGGTATWRFSYVAPGYCQILWTAGDHATSTLIPSLN